MALIASTAAAALAAVRSDIDATLWRFALAPATVAVIAMAVTLAATIAWGATVRAYAPSLLDHDLGFAWFGAVGAVGAVMASATSVAGVSLKRGYAARAMP